MWWTFSIYSVFRCAQHIPHSMGQHLYKTTDRFWKQQWVQKPQIPITATETLYNISKIQRHLWTLHVWFTDYIHMVKDGRVLPLRHLSSWQSDRALRQGVVQYARHLKQSGLLLCEYSKYRTAINSIPPPPCNQHPDLWASLNTPGV